MVCLTLPHYTPRTLCPLTFRLLAVYSCDCREDVDMEGMAGIKINMDFKVVDYLLKYFVQFKPFPLLHIINLGQIMIHVRIVLESPCQGITTVIPTAFCFHILGLGR